jgi:hypothetical protein
MSISGYGADPREFLTRRRGLHSLANFNPQREGKGQQKGWDSFGLWLGRYRSIFPRLYGSPSDISYGRCIGVVLSSLLWPKERP